MPEADGPWPGARGWVRCAQPAPAQDRRQQQHSPIAAAGGPASSLPAAQIPLLEQRQHRRAHHTPATSLHLPLPPPGYIGEFEFVDNRRSGKIVVELIGR